MSSLFHAHNLRLNDNRGFQFRYGYATYLKQSKENEDDNNDVDDKDINKNNKVINFSSLLIICLGIDSVL